MELFRIDSRIPPRSYLEAIIRVRFDLLSVVWSFWNWPSVSPIRAEVTSPRTLPTATEANLTGWVPLSKGSEGIEGLERKEENPISGSTPSLRFGARYGFSPWNRQNALLLFCYWHPFTICNLCRDHFSVETERRAKNTENPPKCYMVVLIACEMTISS